LGSQIVQGSATVSGRRLAEGGWAVVSQQIAEALSIPIGGMLTLPTPTGPAHLRLAATTTNLAWSPGVIFLGAADYRRLFASSLPTALAVALRTGADPTAVNKAIERTLGPNSGLSSTTARARQSSIDSLTGEGLDQLRQISLILLVAAILAMAAALTSAIWSRRAALAGLRLAGVRPGRLRQILLCESALMLGAGCITGALAGVYGQLTIDGYLQHVTASRWQTSAPVCARPRSSRWCWRWCSQSWRSPAIWPRACPPPSHSMSSALVLARANARYWFGLAAFVRLQLARWRERATALEDPRRRTLALAKLEDERLNPQLAATLATQAPRARRRCVAEAIVAAQVAYDYRDALGECSLEDEDEYTHELAEAMCRVHQRLPGWPAVAGVARANTARWLQAQRRGHAAIEGEDGPLREWAMREASATKLGWPEWLAGAQASVLGGHALVALAADDRATSEQAEALDRAYLSIGALTMLDSVIDRDHGTSACELDYGAWYESDEQMGEHLAAAARDALHAATLAPGGPHHAMTLTGIVAFYASAQQAHESRARVIFAPIRRELGGGLRPALAIMRAWRAAKRARSRGTPQARRAWRLAPPAALVAASLATGGPAVRTAQATTGSGADRHGPTDIRDSDRAHSARSLRASDEAHLRYVSASGSTLYETGRASGTLPGPMRVHMSIGPTFSGSFRIYASGGTIAGHGTAIPHGVGVYESFAGSVTLTGGSGRFRHASGSAKLYGTFNRNTYALLIQTEGTLHY
jgi:hypothetical protein